MKTILISACLLGVSCRYDGLSKPLHADVLQKLTKKYHLIPVCPEIFGGLETPRIPAEITKDHRVLRKDGKDITEQYEKGAKEALQLAKLFDANIAILKARSPSCGRDEIYDGSFTGTRIAGDGITASLFKENGICVITENELQDFLNET